MRLAAVGDIMIDHSFSPSNPPFNRAFQITSGADLFLANLEIPFGTVGSPKEKMYAYRCEPSVAKVLLALGVDVVSLANNHMLDYGEEVMLQTLGILTRMRIPHVGAGRNMKEASRPIFLRRRGIRVAFMSLAATLPLGAAASENRPGIAPVHVSTSYEVDPTSLQEQPGDPPKIRTRVDIGDEDRICSNIREVKGKADHVVVGIHWGIAFAKQRAEYQQPLARRMIEAGASLIVGHHPHIRHGIECYRKGVILYSLGDFIFHDRAEMTGESGIVATVELHRSKIRELRLWPISVDAKAGLPVLGDGREGKQLLEEMRQLSPGEDFNLDGESVKVIL